MDEVARLIARAVVKKEDPAKVKRDVEEFRGRFRGVHYCFSPEAKPHVFEDIV